MADGGGWVMHGGWWMGGMAKIINKNPTMMWEKVEPRIPAGE